MENSWIRLHRKIMDDPLYFAEPFTKMQAWIDLLMLANFADRVMYVRGNRVVIKRGQLAYSREWFSGRWRWSRGRVERFLALLESDLKIVQHKSRIISLITIVNYDSYQTTEKTECETNSTTENERKYLNDKYFKKKSASDGTTDGTTDSTTDGPYNNNIYINTHTKEKNKIKKESAAEFERPSIAEVTAYMAEQGTPIDARRFVDYYNSVGWYIGTRPMTDWRAAARMWARTDQVRAAEAAKKEAERKARAERPQIIIQNPKRNGTDTHSQAATAATGTPPPGGWRTRERDDERAERNRRFADYLARLAAEAEDGGSPGL